MIIKRRYESEPTNIWPMFADVLSTVLMVITFVLMTFIISQLYLTESIHDKECQLDGLRQMITNLNHDLAKITTSKREAQKQIDLSQKQMGALQNQLLALMETLGETRTEKETALTKAGTLKNSIHTLESQMSHLNHAISETEKKYQEKDTELTKVQSELNTLLLQKITELQKTQDAYSKLKCAHADLEKKAQDATHRIGQFRSEFFAAFQKIVGNRPDIRVVGDRFIFQSEVLFDVASADLGEEGKKQLDHLASAILEIGGKIPNDIHWVLRVDGHTDTRPICTHTYPSNWELSAARAISVVKYLIHKGVKPHNLVAAGFGECYPLVETEQDQSKNRRIEFKLDQR